MRIIHVITKMHEMYGAQRHAVESIKNHLLNGHECLLIAGTDGDASNEIKTLGVEVIVVSDLKNSYNFFLDRKAILDVEAIIKKFKPDLVISHSSKAGVVARIAGYRTKTPNAFTVQGWPFENGTPFIQRIVALIIEKGLIKISDNYICVSEYTRKFGYSKLPLFKERVFVCPNLHQVNVNTARDTEFKLSYKVLMVAGFRSQKDHLTALKALKLILDSKKIENIQFVFAGDGPKRNEIEGTIQKLNLQNKILLVGATKEIDFYYKNSDIVILPTFYEGLPLSLLEAQCWGKPIIATDTGGINEIIVDNYNGNLIQVSDAEALANHIIRYYSDNLIEKMSINALNYYESKYSHKIITDQLNQIIASAVEKSRYNS